MKHDFLLFIFILFTFATLLFSGVGKAQSGDWVTGDQIIPQGTEVGTGTSTIIKVDGEYKLWYEGYDGSEWHIGYANSSDGENWTKQGEVYNISVDPTDCNVGTADPCVRYIDGTYKLWYTWKTQDYYEGGHDYWTMGYAESPDGITWTNKTDQLTWNPTNVTNQNRGCEWYAYVVNNSTIWMYYVIFDGAIYRSISTDGGLTWQQEETILTNDLQDKVRAPCVLKLSNGSYTMFTGWTDIYQRWSNDGKNWDSAVKIIEAPDGEWENDKIWDPRVYPMTTEDNPAMNIEKSLDYGTWYMVYTGNVGQSGCSNDMKLGIAKLNNPAYPSENISSNMSFGLSLPVNNTANGTTGEYDVSSSMSFGLSLPVNNTTISNQPPTANFTYSADGLTVTFTDTSTDSDGNITSWSWDFGDGEFSTVQNPTHVYPSDGSYNVTLNITDDNNTTDIVMKTVLISNNSSGYIFEDGSIPWYYLIGGAGLVVFFPFLAFIYKENKKGGKK